jgi:hypothetical protein
MMTDWDVWFRSKTEQGRWGAKNRINVEPVVNMISTLSSDSDLTNGPAMPTLPSQSDKVETSGSETSDRPLHRIRRPPHKAEMALWFMKIRINPTTRQAADGHCQKCKDRSALAWSMGWVIRKVAESALSVMNTDISLHTGATDLGVEIGFRPHTWKHFWSRLVVPI